MAARNYPEGMVLDGLEFGSVGGADVGGPDRRGILKDLHADCRTMVSWSWPQLVPANALMTMSLVLWVFSPV